jgi:NAD+ kinase
MELNRVMMVVRPVPKKVPGCRPFQVAGGGSVILRREHARTLKGLIEEFDDLGIKYRIKSRYALRRVSGVDLIISVGGDGTFLASSHKAGATPVLGVNPDPKRSVGFFCMADAKNFGRILRRIIAGKIGPRLVPLIETRIGTKRLPILALNDVLFAGQSPAETVRYCLSVNGRREDQKSSGVWISAGPGSTGAIKSAGGRRQNITSGRLQYLVREPCPIPGSSYRQLGGTLREGSGITIKSSMGRGTVYIDGHGHSYPVPWKSNVTCRASKKSLKIFI